MKACWLLLLLVLGACHAVPNTTHPTSMPNATDIAVSPAQTLQRYHWQLSQAVDSNNQRIDALFDQSVNPLQMDFTGNRVSVSPACNAINGHYRIVGGHLDSQLLMQTMMACMNPTLQQRESVIKAMLQGKLKLLLLTDRGKPQLSLTAANGPTLTFTGEATAQTRYASPGETVFLEVSAQTVPCVAAGDCGALFLRVRERHYDANGQSSGTPGPWQPLQQPIEDFTPEPGVRYVLRLKRYWSKASAADRAAAYVLDTIIESEVAQPAS